MFHLKYLIYFILFHLITGTPQINLYYTDLVSKNDSNNTSKHNCLRFNVEKGIIENYREIISYCMSELPSKFNVENDNIFQKFTFDELSKQKITSQQLYLWSTPIDIIENYQHYLNQLSSENNLVLKKEVYYNCTMPRFGPQCQYQLQYHDPEYSSLNEIIQSFYNNYQYNPTDLICYIHLECNRGPSPSCLDWREICDGKIDCLDGGFDEEHCWQLEINQCNSNEHRCKNGQCIPKSFYRDLAGVPDCFDSSDETNIAGMLIISCDSNDGPSFACEDITDRDGPDTYSYVKKRMELLMTTMYPINDSSVSQDCLSAFKCFFQSTYAEYLSCKKVCEHDECIKIFENKCPDILYFPNVPVLFGNIYFAYSKSDVHKWNNDFSVPSYICYDKSQYDQFFINITEINNMTCIHSESFLSSYFILSFPIQTAHLQILYILYSKLRQYHLIFNYTTEICNRTNMYQCIQSSKCISIYRLMDRNRDCPQMDDENFTLINTPDLIEQLNKTHYKCIISGAYIPQSFVKDGNCDCETTLYIWCEDEDEDITYLKKNIVFQHICDGFIDLLPILIQGRNETDETECEQWKCNNIYNRCNNIWNCLNGVDESGCVSHSTLNCSSKFHLCVSPDTYQFMCLSIEKANDGNVDCLGATDEPKLCGTNIQSKQNILVQEKAFYCMNQSSQLCIGYFDLCDGYDQCEHGDDEQFCTTNGTSIYNSICSWDMYDNASDVEKFLCDYRVPYRNWGITKFRLNGMTNLINDQMKRMENTVFSSLSIVQMFNQYQPRCHRGLDLLVWLNNTNNVTINRCLCPPSFYGDRCQYENQRISLTTKFLAPAGSWQTLFVIIISLIDDSDERIIHSYEQFTYLSARDCHLKFNTYLLYSTRPKDNTKNYSIHIDFYEKESLAYRGSVLFPINFPFLPVHRLSFIVDIPRSNDKTQSCPNDQCGHGKCIKYSNNLYNSKFCKCDRGWSGRYCNIQYTCQCASDSLCIGISANNQSICVCPINKFGPRCLIIDTICQTNYNSTCENGGRCISNVDHMVYNQKFLCICPKNFTGEQCEIADNNITLSFGNNIAVSQSIFIHFIKISLWTPSMESIVRSTTFQTIPVQQDSIIIYWSQPFHLIFTELFNKTYYLTVSQNTYNQSSSIIKRINPSDRCPHINELFNETFVQWHLLRRIKYYHLPCQNESLNLSCFYDDVHFCLCNEFEQQRLSDCFKFDHNMTFDCYGQSECENGGQCLQDKLDCPQRSMCICPLCFYGRLCQFSTSGFGLSLDAILGYHILPDVSITHQPSIIQFSIAVTMIFIVAGLINGVLSMITFKNKSVHEVGCGLYLLCLSIITLLTTIVFALKFWILLIAQMTIISNKSFLQVQCHSIDFLLRFCLSMDQWLNACVSTERTMTVIKGVQFNRKKSKQAAKLVIIILVIVIVGTSIHDPIYRRLIDEENYGDDVNRIWCIITYPSSLQTYNYFIHCFHFFGSFIINLVSSIILITKKSRQQSNIHTHQTYKGHLKEQFREHKHLLTAPIVLVILALPRLIITFVSKCIKSANDSWLFLLGYFISFIPPMLTFIVFIVPSEFYLKEFHKTVILYRTGLQRRFNLIS